MITCFCRWFAGTTDPVLPAVSNDGVQTSIPADHSIIRSARFNSSMVLMREVASYVADQPSSMFATYSAALEQFRQKLLDGQVNELLSAICSIDAQPTSSTTAADEEQQMESMHRVSDVEPDDDVHATEQQQVDNDTAATYSQPASDDLGTQTHIDVQPAAPVDNDIIFQPIPKARGRPALVRQRPFKVFGRKRKCPDDHDAAGTREQAQKQNCAECGLPDPPVKGRRKRATVQWLQCDHCDFWYHVDCTGLKRMPADDVQYECSRCLQGR